MASITPDEADWADPVTRAKMSPAVQMRVMLARSRAAGVPFDRAWESAFERVKWPHDTTARLDWKYTLEDARTQWGSAYDRRSSTVKIRATGLLETTLAA